MAATYFQNIKYLLLAVFCLSGCAITDEERYKRLSYTAAIEKEYLSFKSYCRDTDGYLHVPRRRVQNARPTLWEMQDAVCYYDDTHSRTSGIFTVVSTLRSLKMRQ